MLVGTTAADPVTFNIRWSSALFGNAASATGFITFDDGVLPYVGFPPRGTALPDPSVIDFGITVAGVSEGNGSFGLADLAQRRPVLQARDLGQARRCTGRGLDGTDRRAGHVGVAARGHGVACRPAAQKITVDRQPQGVHTARLRSVGLPVHAFVNPQPWRCSMKTTDLALLAAAV